MVFSTISPKIPAKNAQKPAKHAPTTANNAHPVLQTTSIVQKKALVLEKRTSKIILTLRNAIFHAKNASENTIISV
jgi:hypothetical protein